MICTRCLQRRAAEALLYMPPPFPRPHLLLFTSRYLSSSSPRRSTETPPAAATTPPPSPPFSTPFTPDSVPRSGSVSDDATATNPADAPRKHPRSKTPAGTLLRGLGYLKGQEGPKAWADEDYPEWLWGLLDTDKKGAGGKESGEVEGDMFSKSKKIRRMAAKAARMAAADPSSQEPNIPLQHQSIDLAYGEGTGEDELAGRKAREELKKTIRAERRKAIKERNSLTGIK